jgi:hypothetical protein
LRRSLETFQVEETNLEEVAGDDERAALGRGVGGEVGADLGINPIVTFKKRLLNMIGNLV